MDEIERRLAIVEAKFALSELRSAYCWHTTRGDRQAVVALFTEDGLFQNHRGEDEPVTITGHEALLRHFAPMRPARRVPVVMNEVSHVDGDTAEGTCVMQSFGDDGFVGHYIDRFRVVGECWLFSERRFFPYWPTFAPSGTRANP